MDVDTLLTAAVLGLAFIGYVACVMRAQWITLALTIGFTALIWQSAPPNGDTAFFWLGAGIVLMMAFWTAHLPPLRSKSSTTKPTKTRGKRVVVDGTNVIYWNGDPDLSTLRAVTDALRARDISPLVFLDASTRHHLKDTSLNEKGFARALGLKPAQITICPAGTEADEFLIKFARAEGLPIVSNDRFGDRAQQVKGLKRIKGVITNGKPIFEGF